MDGHSKIAVVFILCFLLGDRSRSGRLRWDLWRAVVLSSFSFINALLWARDLDDDDTYARTHTRTHVP